MNIQHTFKILITTLIMYSLPTTASTIGTYTFDSNELANQLVSGNGQVYNGTDWLFASTAENWQFFDNNEWQITDSPTQLTDDSETTFLAAMPNASNTSFQFELGFSNVNVINEAGADLAFFFLWDQSNNTANISINGFNQNLNFQDIFNADSSPYIANNVMWDGVLQENVKLMVGEINLDDFGFSSGEILTNSINLNLDAIDGITPMALSLVGAINSTPITPVPLPAPLLMLLSGLGLFGWFGRRK